MIKYKVISGYDLESQMNDAAQDGYLFVTVAKSQHSTTIIMEKEVDDA